MNFERNRKNRKGLLLMAGIAVLLALGAVPAPAQAQEDVTRVFANLNWSAGDHGYNEGALCGIQALQGIAGVQLPSIPFEEALLGNIWDRTNMMGAAILAYWLGYVDQAVEAATCSQIHNESEYSFLLMHPNIVAMWLSSR